MNPLFDVVGNIGATNPAQNAGTGLKTGTGCGVTVTLIVFGGEQSPAVGLKV